ncbi:MAG: signal recognition particle-docking protein FtsY [Dehalococcoidia bacterium]|nr:signal recognition particle-docking protein FtsY [Dehalococcoidia bacterium]
MRWCVRFFRSSRAGVDPISGEQARAAEEDVRRTVSATERTRRGWFGRMSGVFSRSSIDDELWDELEEILLGADTGLATAEHILNQLRERASAGQLRDPDAVKQALKELLVDLLKGQESHGGKLWSASAGADPPPPPAIILVVGVNGVGKTTSIAKLAHKYVQDGARVMLAAGDTFRAAAIDQLREWGARVGAEVIAQGPNSDPGAVTFDALTAADARGADVLIIDTAGRLHTKFNLMEELRKLRRVIERKYPDAPHEVLLVLDATTGQNGLAQARTFAGIIGVTSILLTKLDGTSKGGIVFAVTDELGIPVRFVGTGETVDDLAPFVPEDFVDALFAE